MTLASRPASPVLGGCIAVAGRGCCGTACCGCCAGGCAGGGCADAAACTVTRPLITFWPWMVQKKVNVPAWPGVNCTVRDWPGEIDPESVTPLIVNVCGACPELV